MRQKLFLFYTWKHFLGAHFLSDKGMHELSGSEVGMTGESS